ncbi:Melibiose operon regulatory protein [Rubinisphaera italica]|uniref:Melibiose operon regulatory protein n=2 Tax=Rubinisphaera italica TaxID=2527969 RepID=A0A5C5XHZ6_9PLAN|nr:Melibiose operon regulatory protein [Rubinisphaera italica]
MVKKYKNHHENRLQILYEHFPALKIIVEMFSTLDDINLCIKDVDGHYLYVNHAFLRSVPRFRREEVLGKTAFQIYSESLAIGYQHQDQQLLSRGENLSDQLEMITNPDGTLGWYLTNKYLLIDQKKQVHAIIGMSRDLHAVSTKDPRYAKLAVALRKIQTCYNEPLRIQELADEIGLSMSQFERLMHSMIQITPRQYLTRQRVEAAALLLRNTDKKVVDIALDCGFSDQASFSKQFKKITGLPPLRYRSVNRPD